MLVRKMCSKCKTVKLPSEFSRDKSKSSGLSTSCKSCKANYDKQRNYEAPLKKIRDFVRNKSKRLYTGPYKCSVINCGKKAELHHFDYAKPEEVIPLCRGHHSAVHHIDLIYKKLNQNTSDKKGMHG